MAAFFSRFRCLATQRSRNEDVIARCRPNPGLCLWRTTDLPCFMVSLMMVCPTLRPRLRLRTLPLAVLRFRPRHFDDEDQQVSFLFRGSMTRLSISLSTLHAAFADDDARLAFGAEASRFPTGGQPTWGTLQRFSPFHPVSSSYRFLSVSFVSSVVTGLRPRWSSPPPCLVRRNKS